MADHSGEYDIVHTNAYHGFPSLYAAQAKRGNKLVFTPHYHGTGHTFFRSLLHIPYKYVAKTIFNKSDQIVCVSKFEKNLLIRAFNIDEERIILIPNGITFGEFQHYKKEKKDHQTILYVGRLEKYKGIDYVIKTLPKLDDAIVLEIVGEGPYQENLVDLVKALGLESRVQFYQWLPRKELIQKYVTADLYISLSKLEAYGICVAEALASRTVCIVAYVSSLKEWVDGINCFGINYPINLDDLAALINRVIGFQIPVINIPCWDDVIAEHIKLYNELIC